MEKLTFITDSFANLEEFVELAKELQKDSSNFEFIDENVSNMCYKKIKINGVHGIVYGIKEGNKVILTKVEKYSVDRAVKECYSFYRDDKGITDNELAKKVEQERKEELEPLIDDLSKYSIDETLSNSNESPKVIDFYKYKLRKVNIPYIIEDDSFFRRIRNNAYTSDIMIFDKLDNKIIDIKENIYDFIIKHRNRIISVLIGNPLTKGEKEADYKSYRKVTNSIEDASVDEKQAYLNYLSRINREYLYGDENISYYIKTTYTTLNKYKKTLDINKNKAEEIKELLDKQITSIKYIMETSLCDIDNIELEFNNLMFINGELINPKEEKKSKNIIK